MQAVLRANLLGYSMSIMTQEKDNSRNAKRYPSREKLRYVGVPLDIDALLVQYATDHSTVDDVKSKNWAARVLLREILSSKGYKPEANKKPAKNKSPDA